MKPALRIVFLLAALMLAVFACKSKGQQHYEKGLSLFQAGNLPGSLVEYEEGLKTEPQNVNLLYAAGWAYLVQGNQQKAMVYFARCLKFNDHFYGGHKGMAAIYTANGQTDKAEESLKEALKLDPQNASIYSNLGDLYRNVKKFPQAEEAYKKAATLLPKFGDADSGLVALAHAQKNYDQAISLGEAAIKRPFRQKDLQAETYFLLASSYIARGKGFQEVGKTAEAAADLNNARKTVQTASNQFPDHSRFEDLLKTAENAPAVEKSPAP